MAELAKLIRRSTEAVQRLTRNTTDRIEAARAALAAGKYDTNHALRDVAGQSLDTLNVWLDPLRALAERTPSAFIEIFVTGRGTAKVSGAATVVLDEPMASIRLLKATELCSPRGTIAPEHIALTKVDGSPQVEVVKIEVTVPNNQRQGLYQGLIVTGSVVKVEVRTWIHA
jgi:hypothetical protein